MADQRLRLVQANQQQGRQNEMFNEMLRGYATMLGLRRRAAISLPGEPGRARTCTARCHRRRGCAL
jgi:hypothetical protein